MIYFPPTKGVALHTSLWVFIILFFYNFNVPVKETQYALASYTPLRNGIRGENVLMPLKTCVGGCLTKFELLVEPIRNLCFPLSPNCSGSAEFGLAFDSSRNGFENWPYNPCVAIIPPLASWPCGLAHTVITYGLS